MFKPVSSFLGQASYGDRNTVTRAMPSEEVDWVVIDQLYSVNYLPP
jgi:hypothetical protein